MNTLEKLVLNYESHTALNGGGTDGLNIIRLILQQLPYICNNHAICWLEIDPSQPKLIQNYIHTFNEHQRQVRHRELLSKCNNKTNISSKATDVSNQTITMKGIQFVDCVKDLFGQDRFVKLQVVELPI
jgi:methylase of polypeptide subunit release factors